MWGRWSDFLGRHRKWMPHISRGEGSHTRVGQLWKDPKSSDSRMWFSSHAAIKSAVSAPTFSARCEQERERAEGGAVPEILIGVGYGDWGDPFFSNPFWVLSLVPLFLIFRISSEWLILGSWSVMLSRPGSWRRAGRIRGSPTIATPRSSSRWIIWQVLYNYHLCPKKKKQKAPPLFLWIWSWWISGLTIDESVVRTGSALLALEPEWLREWWRTSED